MYAIVKTGGKQYRVSPGDIIRVEKLEGTAGSSVEFTDVLLFVDDDNKMEFGKPFLANVKVLAEITKQTKDNKVIIFKAKRRKGYRKKTGHRQKLTLVKINSIAGSQA